MTAAASDTRRLAFFLMAGAMLSKAFGLVREILVARAIGASVIADSFRGGLTAILLPLAFMQNESVPAVLIPAYREWREDGTAPRRFAALSAALILTACALFLAVQATAPVWIDLLLGGFDPEARALTLAFTRVMALAMPASVLLCCLSAAEIACGRSRLTSARATLTNIAVIAGVVLLLLTGRAIVLAWSFAAAFNALAAYALLLTHRDRTLDWRGATPRATLAAGLLYLRRLRPLVLQPIAEYGQVWIERLLASGLAVGTVASLDYARALSDCAVLLVSQPLGLAVLSAGPNRDPARQVDRLARPLLALALPGSVFLALFAPEIVTVVLHRGAFDAAAVLSTSRVLSGIALGLWAGTLGWVLLRMLNSFGRNRHATYAVAAAYAANAAVAAALVPSLGTYALGAGEAVRGVVLLAGVTLALGAVRPMLRLLALCLVPTALLIAAELAVRASLDGTFARLGAGTAAAAIAAAALLTLLTPQLWPALRLRLSRSRLA